MSTETLRFLDELSRFDQLDADARANLRRAAAELNPSDEQDADALLAAIVRLTASRERDAGARAVIDPVLLSRLMDRLGAAWSQGEPPGRERQIELISQAYRQIRPDIRGRIHLLRGLAEAGSVDATHEFLHLLTGDPPATGEDCALAVAPWFQSPPQGVESLFPKLWEALGQPRLAPVILDLANFWTEQGVLPVHPGTARRSEFEALLSGLIGQLARLEQSASDRTPEQLRTAISEAEALCTSLCRTLALLPGQIEAQRLRPALKIRHRRMRTAIAALLARQHDPEGVEVLLGMTAEPLVRREALVAADELGLKDRVPWQFTTSEAWAEAELAAWLAEPAQFGVAPTRVEALDSRRMFWPGFEQPIDCTLVEYEYQLAGGRLRGVGIAGPATYAVTADVEGLSPDDLYALYAGWQAEHPEMRETPAADLSPGELQAWETMAQLLATEGFEQVELVKRAAFFGELDWVATAQRDGQRGVLVVSGTSAEFIVTPGGPRALNAEQVYWLHRGRRILATFNAGQEQGLLEDEPIELPPHVEAENGDFE
jgi:hypothetical protein